ncbi:MAG TPA: hypothetical protein VKB79_13280 [Bryobacteraceae bacterium]|nr:hypothetical protein [Bryobacteraceae bacterium]
MNVKGFRRGVWMSSIALFGITLPTFLVGQTQIQFDAFYTCPGGTRFKVFSCAGNEPGSSCDVQTFSGTRSLSRGPAPRGQVMGFVRTCHLQTAAEEKAVSARGAAQAESSSNGINVGDSVEVLTGFGWTPAKVLAIQGNDYKVNANGVQVIKTYPSEVRRVGAANARDHAAGQYRLHDRVQVNVGGQWMDGTIVLENGMDYQVQFGNRTVWAGPKDLRPSSTPAPAATAKTTGPPQPGMTSCAGKIEGRYVTTGAGSATIIFRSGKATMGNGFGGEDTLECWVARDKIILREPGHPEKEMPIDINNDGTLQVPIYGEFKKKGN